MMKKYLSLLFLSIVFYFNVPSLLASATARGSAVASEGSSVTYSLSDFSISGMLKPLGDSDSATDYTDIAVHAGLSHPKIGFSHVGGVMLENKSYNDAYFVTLTIKYDTTAALVSSSMVPVSGVPGVMVFYFDTLHAYEQVFISMDFTVPADPALMGHDLWLMAGATVFPQDYNLANNVDNTSQEITGSFDPNAKSVIPEGFGFPHYVPITQEEFRFTIEFQNTGTDTAINILILDTLSSYFDPVTIQPGASSHPYTWELLANGILKFHFYSINLPDSSTNEPRSHGFVTYKINARHGLSVGTNIKNSAHIYFDFNPPIATNTTANELFDCNNITSFTLNQNTLCEGAVLPVFQNSVIPHTSNWYVDSTWVAQGDTFVFSSLDKGIHQIVLVAQTPYCNQVISLPVTVMSPVKPVISQDGHLLMSTPAMAYQWFLDGVMIPGAQQISTQFISTGWYYVLITDGSGCIAYSDSLYVTNTGMPVVPGENGLVIRPNPFNDMLFVTTSLNEECKVQLTGLEGKLFYSGMLPPGNIERTISTSGLPKGVYILRITGNGTELNRLITKN